MPYKWHVCVKRKNILDYAFNTRNVSCVPVQKFPIALMLLPNIICIVPN